MMHNNPFSNRGSEVKFIAILLVALVLILVASVVLGLRIDRGASSVPTGTATLPIKFPEVSITAKSAYVYDVRTKTVLFAKEESARRPLASLTKVMTALIAEERGQPYSTVVVTSEAMKAMGDSGFDLNERWSLSELLDFSLVTSSNDGMRAIALTLGALDRSNATPDEIINDFVVQMNIKASELGLKNSYFYNETGLDESDIRGGAYATAKDVNTLMEYILIYHPTILTATKDSSAVFSSLDNINHIANNTNIITGEIPGLVASKTGYTTTAGGNLSIIFDPEIGRPIIVTVLASTGAERFEDVKALVDATMEYIQQE